MPIRTILQVHVASICILPFLRNDGIIKISFYNTLVREINASFVFEVTVLFYIANICSRQLGNSLQNLNNGGFQRNRVGGEVIGSSELSALVNVTRIILANLGTRDGREELE